MRIGLGDRVKFTRKGTIIFGRVLKVNRTTFNVEDEKIRPGDVYRVPKDECHIVLRFGSDEPIECPCSKCTESRRKYPAVKVTSIPVPMR